MQESLADAEVKDIQAIAIANTGLGIERESRVTENESLSIERRAQAALDEIKAIKELEDMDISQITNILNAINIIKVKQEEEATELSA